MRKFYHQPAFIGCVSLSTGIDYIDVYMSCIYSSQGGCASLPSIALTHQALSAHRSHERGYRARDSHGPIGTRCECARVFFLQ